MNDSVPLVGVIEFGLPAFCDECTQRLLVHLAHELGAFERHRASTVRAREMEARTLAERERARIYQLFTEAPALISVTLGPNQAKNFVDRAVQILQS